MHDRTKDYSTINIWSDGGARGNPGPAAIGYIIKDKKDHTLISHHEYIGETTNNIAEYSAVFNALKKLTSHLEKKSISASQIQKINIYLDSLLVVKQLNGEFKIKEPKLFQFASQILKHISQSKFHVIFTHIPREKNTIADSLVNISLDEQLLS